MRTLLRDYCQLVAGGLLLLSTIVVSAAELSLDELFRADRVTEVKIQVAQEDWDTIRKQSRDFMEALSGDRREGPVAGPYTYVKADVEINGVTFSGVGLRKKGFIGSLRHTRPSLKVKLDHRQEGAHLGGLTSLTFNNNK